MQPVVETESTFSIKRDSIYVAVVLWGLGGSVLMVLSLSMISILTGEYTVSITFNRPGIHDIDTTVLLLKIRPF